MLMPGRYLSDTTARCQTITQTRFFTTYVDSCWTVPGWPIWNPWVIRIGNATVTPAGTAIHAVLPDPSSMFYISRTAVPSAINHVSLLVESVSNPVVISVVETVDGQEVVLAEQLLQAAQMSTVSFSITPSTPSIRIRVRWFTAPAIIRWRTICVQVPQMQSETYLVDVCDEIGDQYRFGFNGQEKVNEMSGIGNHNTAEFWEYDTRVARRWNVDPIFKEYESPYSAFGGNPILNIDPDGQDTISTNNVGYSDPPGGGKLEKTFKEREKPQRREGLVFVEESPEFIAISEFIFNITPILGQVNIIQQQFTGESLLGNPVEPANSAMEMVLPTIGKVPKISTPKITAVQSEANVVREAEKLSHQIGKNSVTIKRVNGHSRYDLKGAAHKHSPTGIEILTPHKIPYKTHSYEKIIDKHSKRTRTFYNTSKPKNPTMMDKQDIRIIRNYLKSLNK